MRTITYKGFKLDVVNVISTWEIDVVLSFTRTFEAQYVCHALPRLDLFTYSEMVFEIEGNGRREVMENRVKVSGPICVISFRKEDRLRVVLDQVLREMSLHDQMTLGVGAFANG